MIRVRAPQDLGAAVIFLVVGAVGLYFGRQLTGMRVGGQLGSGTVPTILSWICIVFSAVLCVRSLLVDGAKMDPVPWRAAGAVGVSVLFFAFSVESIGYVFTAFATPLMAMLANKNFRWREAVLISALLSFGTTFLFVVLLGQPIPLFWSARY